MPKIVTAFVVLSCLSGVFGANSAVVLPLLTLFFLNFPKIYVHSIKKQLDKSVLLVVQHMISGLCAGKSVFSAFDSALTALHSDFAEIFSNLNYIRSVKLNQFGPNFRRFHELWCIIRNESYGSLDQLRDFQQTLRQEQRFMRKVKSGLAPLWAQLSILILFYFTLLILNLYQSLLSDFGNWILLSLALTLIGSFLIYRLPWRIKWN